MKPSVLVCIFVASISVCCAVRVNLHGSFSLGKDILSAFARYMQRSKRLDANRRSGADLSFPSSDKVAERIKGQLNVSQLGQTLESCKGPIGGFVAEYVTKLAYNIESIFNGVMELKSEDENKNEIIFKDPLKNTISEVQNILAEFDNITVKDENKFQWVIVIKLISYKFQDATMNFTAERLNGYQNSTANLAKKLNQKLFVAILEVENNFLSQLCAVFGICENDHTCTTTLHNILEGFQNAEKEKAVEFIKIFYENLPVDMFSFLNPETWDEFQVILSDLSYAINDRAKEVLISVYKAVDTRTYFLKGQGISNTYDQQLVNVILSDMDAIYHTNRPTFPFHNFLGQFSNWLRLGGKFSPQMRVIVNEIREKLSSQPPGLINKLKKEIQAFLEFTIEEE